MELAENNAARLELASKNLRKGGSENLERLARIIALRQAIANMLGYPTHADFAEEVRMSKTVAAVKAFLDDIIARLAPAVLKELQDLVAMKQRTIGLKEPLPIEFHEGGYWSTKLKKERYNFDPEVLKEYFPLAHVLEGIFGIYQKLLGVRFEKVSNVALWHPDAQLYVAYDSQTSALIGHFILDLYPRTGKYGHAAAFSPLIGRIDVDGKQTTGIMTLVCNFPKPTSSNPSLMAHDQVETLLHEFGHVCHGLLSGGKWQHQNGLYVPLDFVEAPSQMLEHWAWDPRSLAKLSSHYQTGDPVPPELIEKLLASRRHQQARYYMTQAVRALYDLRIHSQPTDLSLLAQLYRDMKLTHEHIALPDDAIFAAGWGHMGDYDAGYYSYLWSKVYALDLFTRFAKNPLDAEVGRQFRDRVLAPGASRPEQQLIEDFLGRASSSAAFLAALGIS